MWSWVVQPKPVLFPRMFLNEWQEMYLGQYNVPLKEVVETMIEL